MGGRGFGVSRGGSRGGASRGGFGGRDGGRGGRGGRDGGTSTEYMSFISSLLKLPYCYSSCDSF